MDRERGSSPVISCAAWPSEGDLILRFEITQCLEITRQCQRYGVSNQTSIQLFDLGKGGLTGWLTDHPKVRRNWSSVCDSNNVEAISEIWYWVTWPTFKAKQQRSNSNPRSDIPTSFFMVTCIQCVCEGCVYFLKGLTSTGTFILAICLWFPVMQKHLNDNERKLTYTWGGFCCMIVCD